MKGKFKLQNKIDIHENKSRSNNRQDIAIEQLHNFKNYISTCKNAYHAPNSFKTGIHTYKLYHASIKNLLLINDL